MGAIPEEQRQGPPSYMVSFGDMMTLVLTFFILLVSLSKEQNFGLLASGLGSFVVAIQSHGLDGLMSASEQQEVFEHTRRRFNLPPLETAQVVEHDSASLSELLRASAAKGLEPHDEIGYPRVALFDEGEAMLSAEARRYLDRLAPSLQPQHGQVLLLEGHAHASERRAGADSVSLAFRRAQQVATYLIEQHGLHPDRLGARAWHEEIGSSGSATRAVDARLVTQRSSTRR